MESNHWYVPGKNSVEKQHLSEHETLQILQRHALNGKKEEFYELLKTIDGEDKKRDIIEICGM
jgi:hypothetical protein